MTNLLTGLTSVSSGYIPPTFSANSKVTILAANIYFWSGGNANAQGIAVSDFDGNGKPDIVMDLQACCSWVSVCRKTSFSSSINSSSFDSAVKFGFSGPPHGTSALLVGDVDGDGKPEVALGHLRSDSFSTTSKITVLRNTATVGIINSSSFAEKFDVITGSGPTSPIICDLNGDERHTLQSGLSGLCSWCLGIPSSTRCLCRL